MASGTQHFGAAVTSSFVTVVQADSQRHFMYIENQATSAGNVFVRLDGQKATGGATDICIVPGDYRVFGGNFPEVNYLPALKGAPPTSYSPNCPQQTVSAIATSTANLCVLTISYPGA